MASARAWLWAVLVVLIVAGIAAPLAYFGGYVSPDGSSYLELAHRIVAHGELVHTPPHGDGQPVPFTTWPVGYPLFVAAASTLTGLDALGASKILAFGFLAAALACIVRAFGARTQLLTLAVFLLPSSVRIFTYSWSEQLFIVAVFATVLGLDAVARRRQAWVWLALAMVLAFLARYIGIVVPIAVAVAVTITRPPQRRTILFACAVALALDGAYLFGNWLAAGRTTGVERIPAPETLTVLALGLMRSLAQDAATYVLVLGMAAVQLRLVGAKRLRAFAMEHRTAVHCIALGVVYLAALFTLRSTRHFDFFNPRLTFPGVAPILVGLCQLVKVPRWASVVTLVLSGLYLAIWTGSHLRSVDVGTNAEARLAACAEAYADVPHGSIVILPASTSAYLQGPQRIVRPDLVLVRPRYAPYYRVEGGPAFADRIERIHAANGGAPCFADFRPFETVEEMSATLHDDGVSGEVVELLRREFTPGTVAPVRCVGLGGHA
jgi:hypothetical protein